MCGAVSALLGFVDSERLPGSLSISVVLEIGSHSFAVVTPEVAQSVHLADIIEGGFLSED